MSLHVTDIWRHPIKSHGRESIASVLLSQGRAMPYDRLWAVAHDASDADGSVWVPCGNFSRGSKAPGLAAITARLDETTETVTLSHPDRDDLVFHPDTEGDKLIAWAGGFIPANRAQSTRVIRAAQDAFTDTDFPSVTLANLSSHRAVEQRVGQPLSIHRWRANIWLDGGAPWEEFDWLGREIQLGEVVFRVRERAERCLATHNNPDKGRRDVNVLDALDSWNHRDFSVYAEVIKGGRLSHGDTVKVIR